ncbi:MAG: type IIA DNA topoisomerase subunit B [Bacteroides sp.]|nr:type IIA DNA topoisomerase subunit B [Bacteroides sp.]
MTEDINIFDFDETEAQETPVFTTYPGAETDTPEEDEADTGATDGSSAIGTYDDDAIKSLQWNVHIRRRPGMYIGKLGDGSHSDDGIYVLVKEIVDNGIDEFNMDAGKRINIDVDDDGNVAVRDFGRGIPLGKVREVASEINTGGKFDGENFKKSVGLNGVGLKAVNALSTYCEVTSVREGKMVRARFEKGEFLDITEPLPTNEANGTLVKFRPDPELFKEYRFRPEFLETMVNNYTYLNVGLSIYLNGKRYVSRHGLKDLLSKRLSAEPLYPPIHLKGDDIEVVITHTDQNGEDYYSFVNGQYTTQGGTHLSAFREHVSRTIKEFSGKGYEFSDIRNGMVAAVAVRIQEPMFESQTKTKLGSPRIKPDETSTTVNKFVGDFIKKELDDFLHKNTDTADEMLQKIATTEKARKAMSGVAKMAREKAKKVSLHNKKLRDCRWHLNDTIASNAKEDRRKESSIFITEGLSATGTITKVRNAETQAVFSLRGKPLNSFGMTKEVVYKNDEFNLLQAALNIEDSIDDLRYNNVIIATDADVDGMHIRLLVITFFLTFFPDLVKEGHVYILQTPLFRVRNKKTTRRAKGKKKLQTPEGEKDTYYCYTDEERLAAIEKFGANAEITRFKGLGEINDVEFAEFIGPDMRLDPVTLSDEDTIDRLMEYYMGKNSMDRQNFIIDNLVLEDENLEEEAQA